MLEGKSILISSGTKGVGRALVRECALLGADVVFSGRDRQAAGEILDGLSADGLSAAFHYCDTTDMAQVDELFGAVLARNGRIDGYVNYTGIAPVASLTETDEALFDWVMSTNVKGAFFSVARAVGAMLKKGGGSIVLFGSAHSWSGQKDRAAYAVSKGALYTLCEHVAHNYACEQVRCNYLTMGWTATEGELALRKSQGMTADQLNEEAAAVLPMGRMCTPEDVVPAVVYLLSDQSSFVTGANIRCTGGEYIS